ncbi:uncharacterized protein BO97DRAFT_417671 [Aspergillus homomorphus CBS 101889]|uniref:Uncharacterized protein n=1 Tax=Aspergillus homomorphus (strain CBS 101889) TaxID=1450537 RepID=A0A395HLN9_ASPHC|nr:hypothetical protein BO97DRAFT_417671 [Aspergillus homomorphus CBS 101889]RAL08516.1 hypothetical protein BO97DRAFT_417671 [Aspergillus homomorphus CBS 101889]
MSTTASHESPSLTPAVSGVPNVSVDVAQLSWQKVGIIAVIVLVAVLAITAIVFLAICAHWCRAKIRQRFGPPIATYTPTNAHEAMELQDFYSRGARLSPGRAEQEQTGGAGGGGDDGLAGAGGGSGGGGAAAGGGGGQGERRSLTRLGHLKGVFFGPKG